MNIAEKMYVSIDYKLSIDGGQQVDSSQEGQPLGFITGAGQIIPGLEKALIGRTAGDSARITVAPEEAYGPVQDTLFQEVPKDQFPADTEITAGMTFQAQGPQGPFMVAVSKVNDQTITVDLNHPLAGKTLDFDITVVDVREATTEELAQLEAAAAEGCGCGGGEAQPTECGPGCSCG
jgi:FKBP-type peptidyl-prolyl cis-trans isomerase SlyD